MAIAPGKKIQALEHFPSVFPHLKMLVASADPKPHPQCALGRSGSWQPTPSAGTHAAVPHEGAILGRGASQSSENTCASISKMSLVLQDDENRF